jgi:hypothetical protein
MYLPSSISWLWFSIFVVRSYCMFRQDLLISGYRLECPYCNPCTIITMFFDNEIRERNW